MTEKTNQIVKQEDTNTPILQSIGKLSDGIINKSNCKFCQSKNRIEAESEYERVGSIKAVHNLLKSKGDEISYLSVRNHLINHYEKQEENLKLREYSENLSEWMGEEKSRKQTIKERIAIFTRELTIIASETEGKSLDERRKSAEALKKMGDTITLLEDKLEDMEERVAPAIVVINYIQDIVSERIKKSTNNEMKKEYMTLLTELKEKIGGLEIIED